jgi:hypothetical protein
LAYLCDISGLCPAWASFFEQVTEQAADNGRDDGFGGAFFARIGRWVERDSARPDHGKDQDDEGENENGHILAKPDTPFAVCFSFDERDLNIRQQAVQVEIAQPGLEPDNLGLDLARLRVEEADTQPLFPLRLGGGQVHDQRLTDHGGFRLRIGGNLLNLAVHFIGQDKVESGGHGSILLLCVIYALF